MGRKVYLNFSKLLQSISQYFRFKAIYWEMRYYLVNCIMGNGSHIKDLKPHERGIGKTYALIKLAHQYNIPIIVGTQAIEHNLKRTNEQCFKGKPIEVITANIYTLRGKRIEVALLDEGVNYEVIDEIMKISSKGVVGYSNPYFNK